MFLHARGYSRGYLAMPRLLRHSTCKRVICSICGIDTLNTSVTFSPCRKKASFWSNEKTSRGVQFPIRRGLSSTLKSLKIRIPSDFEDMCGTLVVEASTNLMVQFASFCCFAEIHQFSKRLSYDCDIAKLQSTCNAHLPSTRRVTAISRPVDNIRRGRALWRHGIRAIVRVPLTTNFPIVPSVLIQHASEIKRCVRAVRDHDLTNLRFTWTLYAVTAWCALPRNNNEACPCLFNVKAQPTFSWNFPEQTNLNAGQPQFYPWYAFCKYNETKPTSKNFKRHSKQVKYLGMQSTGECLANV